MTNNMSAEYELNAAMRCVEVYERLQLRGITRLYATGIEVAVGLERARARVEAARARCS